MVEFSILWSSRPFRGPKEKRREKSALQALEHPQNMTFNYLLEKKIYDKKSPRYLKKTFGPFFLSPHGMSEFYEVYPANNLVCFIISIALIL